MIQISNKILGLKKTSKGVSEKYFLTLTVLCCYICFSLYLKFFNFHCPVSYPFIYSEQLHVIIIFKRLLLIFPSSSYLVPHFKMHHISIFLTWKSLCSFLFSCVKRSLIPGINPIIIYISSLVHYLVIYWPGTTIFLFFVTDKFIFVDVHIFLHVLKISKSHQNLVFTKIC